MRLKPVPRADAEPPQQRPATDLGGDLTTRALRLGEAALGAALSFTKSGSLLDADGGRMKILPERAFEETLSVAGENGETLGTLRAVQFASREPFDGRELSTLADVAALVSTDLALQRGGQFYDHVTGLPNRRSFERDCAARAEAVGSDPRLMLVTLAEARHYNEILRAFGHHHAEVFIRRGVDMVLETIGVSVAIYHVSVLSFAFLTTADDAERLARAVLERFREPVMCDTVPVTTRIGVGFTSIDIGAVRPREALRQALAAAQDSRGRGLGYAHYDPISDNAHVRAFGLLVDLEEALRDYGQLHLAYQPRVDLATGATVGAEALMRWNHPTLGAVPPSDFIQISETTSLISQLTEFALTRATRQSEAWRKAGIDIRMSINISPANLHEPGFLDGVDRILASSGADPAGLEFEFTEGVLTSSDGPVRATIDGIRARGVAVAVDDFGMGYSNIGFLTRLPADVLKVDRSLVQSIDRDPRRQRLCKAMVELAQDLDFRVVAEGIETAAEYDILANWRCDEGQGYFMSRPLPPQDFAAFAASR